MPYVSTYAPQNTMPIPMTIDELKRKLCKDSRGDAYACIGCPTPCDTGKEMVKILEIQTAGGLKPMSKKEMYTMRQRIDAMTNYVEAMNAADPTMFVLNKYGLDTERQAKNKIYQWQHNYGTNLGMISNKIKELQLEISVSQSNLTVVPPDLKKPEIEAKTKPVTEEIKEPEKKMTRRQEEKNTQSHLEKMRSELENAILAAEDEIKEHQKAIEKCNTKITESEAQIQAIRQVLEIFKKKDAEYV